MMERRKDLRCIDQDGNIVDDAYAFTVDGEKLFKPTNLHKTIFMLSSVNPDLIKDAETVYNNNRIVISQSLKDYNIYQEAVKHREENQYYSRYFKKDLNLKPQNIARIFYLSTYLARENNYILTKNKNYATKKDIKKILDINKSAFFEFWDDVSVHKVILEDDAGVILDPGIFTRQNSVGKGTPMLRCFNTIQELYETASPTQHKNIGYIFKLVPYLNTYHNIICTNPEEHNISKVVPLTTEEICIIIGYEYCNASRLMKTLNKLSIFRNNVEEYIFLNVHAEEYKHNITIVNPLFFYGGEWVKKDMVSGIFSKNLYSKKTIKS